MKDKVFVNVQMEPEIKDVLEEMANQDERSRSALVRWLIVNEWNRRNDVKVPQKQDTAN